MDEPNLAPAHGQFLRSRVVPFLRDSTNSYAAIPACDDISRNTFKLRYVQSARPYAAPALE